VPWQAGQKKAANEEKIEDFSQNNHIPETVSEIDESITYI